MEHFRFGPGSLLGRFLTGNDQGKLAARFILGKIGTRLRNRATPDLFMQLGKLPGDGDLAVAEGRLQVRQCIQQAVRRFEEDEGIRQIGNLSCQGFAVGGFAGKVAEIQERISRQTRSRQGGDGSGWAGDGTDNMAGGQGSPDEFVAGVVNGGSAGIGDEGHIPLRQRVQDGIEFGELVMLEITGEGGMQVKMGEQFAGEAGILGGNEAHFAQDPQGARAQVFQVADGGGDEIEAAHGVIVSLTFER